MYKIIFFLIASFTYLGCNLSPYVHYDVIPVNDKSLHESRSIFNVEDDDAGIFLNFDSQTPTYFSFFAVIKNKSDSSIVLYPEDIYAEAFYVESTDDTVKPVYLYSFNPDYQLEALDKDLVELEEEREVNNTISCCLAGIFVAGSVIEAGIEKTEEEEIAEEDAWDNLVDKVEQDEINYENEKYELESQKEFFQYEVLNTTSIGPGDKIAGLFYIPIKPQTKWFRIVIPIGEKEYVFNYKQVRN